MKNLKRILFASLLILFVMSINAQTSAGKFLIGGSSAFNFSSTTEKYKSDDGDGTNGKNLDLNLVPQVGYFVMDGLAVGLELNITYSSYKVDGAADKSSGTTLVAAPFVRYYYGASKIKPYGEGAFGFGTYIDKYPDFEGTQTDKYGVFAWQLKGGIGVFLNDAVSFDLGLGYQSLSVKAKENNDANYRDITSGIGLEIGITIIL
jgi:outer membrane protein